ncbi:hypothetical protein [Alicyclobacillus fodiniaquatilis]|uniref:Copper amine oxidase-like N-terminal domain-containing protein n=1 Tax=Alicyclobacillus fodiniaquatilis TaxID=1661150 RepID=A0ABW4JHA2_9BACL
MKKSSRILLSTMVVCISGYVPAVHAKMIQTVYTAPTQLVLNGKDESNPVHLVRRESVKSEPTSWLPIWYLFGTLTNLSIHSTWNGHDWNLTLPSSMPVDWSNPPKKSTNSSDVSIEINGTPVEYAPRYAYRDSSGHKMTSYIPIWYLMQALKRVGITSTWDGTSWSMTTEESTPHATKLQVVKDFVNTLHMSPDTSGSNPYDDVSAADWPYVNAVIQKGYFTADSGSHFGSTDAVNVETVDHAYQLYVGIPDSDITWNAGGNTVAWANAVELNQGVGTGILTNASETQLMSNLSALYHGYSENSNGTYRLWFQPYDAKVAFAHNPDVTAAMASSGQANTFSLADQITFSVQGNGKLTFVLPWLSDQNKMEITCGSLYNPSGNHTEYSLDQGGTWHQATGFYGFDSRDPGNGGTETNASEVWVQTEQHAELGISEIFPNHDITFVQTDLIPSSSAAIPQITDSSGQPVWKG